MDYAPCSMAGKDSCLAEQSQHELIRPEHLLLALLDGSTAATLLEKTAVDIGAIRERLEAYLQGLTAIGTPPKGPYVHPLTQGILVQFHVEHTRGGSKSAGGDGLLLALLEHGGSYAAEVLLSEGASLESLAPESAKLQKEQELQREMRLAQFENKWETLQGGEEMPQASRKSRRRGARPVTIRVRGESSSVVRFKAAVSHGGRLELLIEETPFELELQTDNLAALFEVIDPGTEVRMEALETILGEWRVSSSAGGQAGAIFSDDRLNAERCAGSL